MSNTKRRGSGSRRHTMTPADPVTMYGLIRTPTGWHIVRTEIERELAEKRVVGPPDIKAIKLRNLETKFAGVER